MLALKSNLPEFNFQHPNEFELERLLAYVKPHIPIAPTIEPSIKVEIDSNVKEGMENSTVSYQVVYEKYLTWSDRCIAKSQGRRLLLP